jgi:hypothetical protein
MVGGHNSFMPRRPVYPVGKGDSWMATIIACTESHYEAQMMPYGKAYVSYPESVMAECDCGERQVLTASEAVCRYGSDHTTLVREERASDGGTRPWDEEYGEWRKSESNACGWRITAG